MITAEEFFREKIKELYPFKDVITLSTELISAEQGMRWGHEYSILKSKFYVEAALKQASEFAYIDWEDGTCEDDRASVDIESILNAYPLENIK